MASLAHLRHDAHAAAGFRRSTQHAGTATLLTLAIGTGAWLADAAWLIGGAMIANAVVQVALVAIALTRGLDDDAPTIEFPERLALLALFLATYGAGVAFAGWGVATTVLIAAYATVLSAFGLIAAFWIAAYVASLVWEAGMVGLTCLLGGVMVLGGLVWMYHLGGPSPAGSTVCSGSSRSRPWPRSPSRAAA